MGSGVGWCWWRMLGGGRRRRSAETHMTLRDRAPRQHEEIKRKSGAPRTGQCRLHRGSFHQGCDGDGTQKTGGSRKEKRVMEGGKAEGGREGGRGGE